MLILSSENERRALRRVMNGLRRVIGSVGAINKEKIPYTTFCGGGGRSRQAIYGKASRSKSHLTVASVAYDGHTQPN